MKPVLIFTAGVLTGVLVTFAAGILVGLKNGD
jgi:hypothetical protein